MQKIAVWRAVGAAFAFTFLHPFRWLRLGILWLALIVAILALGRMSFLSLRGLSAGWAVAAFVLCFIVAGIMLFGGLYSFCVALHRVALVGEIRPWFAALRFGRREWLFLGYSLLVGILMSLPLIPVELVAVPFAMRFLRTGDNFFVLLEWSPAIKVALTLMVWTYGARLFLVFPAIAADETGERLSRAWARSRGNGLRVFVGSVICLLPFVGGASLAQWLRLRRIVEALRTTKDDSFVTVARDAGLYQAVSAVAFLLGLVVLVGFYSYCYLRLTPPASAATSAVPQPAPAPVA